MKKLILTFLLLSFSSVPTFGATYYISPTGTATWPNCITSGPCSISQLEANDSSLSPGDEVVFRDGTYRDLADGTVLTLTNVHGNATEYIIFKAENDHRAVFDQNQNPGAMYGIQVLNTGGGASYLRFEGLKLQNMNFGITLNDWGADIPNSKIHHIVIYNCILQDFYNWNTYVPGNCPGNSCSHGVFTGRYTTYVTIDRCFFKDFGRIPADIYWIHDYAHDDQAYLQGAYHTVQNSVFHGTLGGRAVKIDQHNIDCAGNCWTHRIVNNTFHGADATLRGGQNPSVATASGAILMFFNGEGTSPKRSRNVYIGNNIFHDVNYGGGSGAYTDFDSAIWLGIIDANSCGTFTDFSTLTLEHNVTNGQYLIGPCTESAIINAGGTVVGNIRLNNHSHDIGMTDPNNHDFTLDPGATGFSYVHQTASPTHAPTWDFLGTLRPTSGGHDIGAYNYTAQPPSPPLPPQNVRIINP